MSRPNERRDRGAGKWDWTKQSKTVDIGHPLQSQYRADAPRHAVAQHEDGTWHTLCTDVRATREFLGWHESVQCIACRSILKIDEGGEDDDDAGEREDGL